MRRFSHQTRHTLRPHLEQRRDASGVNMAFVNSAVDSKSQNVQLRHLTNDVKLNYRSKHAGRFQAFRRPPT